MLLSWLAGLLLRYGMARLRAGDPRILLALDAEDVQLTFPGRSSFSGVFSGKPAVTAWLRRFAALGFQIFPDEIAAVGPPWKTTVGIRGHIWLRDDAGATVYENRYVIWGHLRWGKLHRYEVYEDTEMTTVVDAWIAEHRPQLATLTVR